MEDLPLVSIITIVYNGEKYIEQTIKSVIGQTYPNVEYIIVDGGSTDNTINIVRQFGDSIHSLISEKDQGISDAFNKGLRRAKGEIIGIINADDWYEKDAIEMAVRNIAGYDVVYGDLRMWKDGEIDFVITGDHHRLKKEMTINHPTVFVRRTCYDRFGFFDQQYKCAMDYDMMLRFLVNGSGFRNIPHTLANMRWEGLSDSKWLLGCQETRRIKNKYLPGRKWQNRLYFYKHILAISLPKFLEKIKLGLLVRTYRARFSRLKKVYE
jgi:glycosyltransferase involved in cell wall biosynthesis